MNTCIQTAFILPVRSFTSGKSRLASVFSDKDRTELNISLFRNTVLKLRQSRLKTDIIVVTSDDSVVNACERQGVISIKDMSPVSNLSYAVQLGAEEARHRMANWICYIPVDLPLLDTNSIDSAVELAVQFNSSLIVPGKSSDTTAMLLTRSQIDISYSFGPGSFWRHFNSLINAYTSLFVYRNHSIETDLDEADDVYDIIYALNKIKNSNQATKEQIKLIEILNRPSRSLIGSQA